MAESFSWWALLRSHEERRCSNLGPTQSRISPSLLGNTKTRDVSRVGCRGHSRSAPERDLLSFGSVCGSLLSHSFRAETQAQISETHSRVYKLKYTLKKTLTSVADLCLHLRPDSSLGLVACSSFTRELASKRTPAMRLEGRTSCVVKSFSSRSFFILSPLWKP